MTVCFVCIVIGTGKLEQPLLMKVFPDQEPPVTWWDEKEWRRSETQLVIQWFGIDPRDGPAGVLHQFGRPSRARYSPHVPLPWGGGYIEVWDYTYPTFVIGFFDKQFAGLEVLAREDRFPIGVTVGDSEQHILDVLGPPPFHHANGNWSAVWESKLEIDVKNGRVVRLFFQ